MPPASSSSQLARPDELDGDAGERLPDRRQPEPEPDGSNPKAIAVGAGVAVGVGLLGFGVYRLGAHLGWWGHESGGIVIDDSKGSSDSKSDSKNEGGKDTNGGSKRASGSPPNMTKDPEGYPTGMFPSSGAVRLVMKQLGYAVEYNAEPLYTQGKPHAEVTRFQREWNRVIRGIDAGRVKLPTGVEGPEFTAALRGVLDEDGVPGKNTLNGLYIALGNTTKNSLKWRDLVSEA